MLADADQYTQTEPFKEPITEPEELNLESIRLVRRIPAQCVLYAHSKGAGKVPEAGANGVKISAGPH